jgi:hypothetical protein
VSGDPHVIARNVRATRSTVEAIAAKLGIELNEHGEPAEPGPAAPEVQVAGPNLDQTVSSLVSGYDATGDVAISGQTPALARAEAAQRTVTLGDPDSPERYAARLARATVCAALHDPDDGGAWDTLMKALYRADYPKGPRGWDELNAVTWAAYRRRADAVRAAILGARGEEVSRG